MIQCREKILKMRKKREKYEQKIRTQKRNERKNLKKRLGWSKHYASSEKEVVVVDLLDDGVATVKGSSRKE